MGENSAISWTDHTLFSVFSHMTISTESKAVRDFETKFWIFREAKNMMCVKVATTRIATFLAGEAVPIKNVVAPAFILFRKAYSATFNQFSIFEGMTGWPSWCGLPSAFTYPSPLLKSSLPSSLGTWLSYLGKRYRGFCLFGVSLTLKGGYSPFSAFPYRYSATCSTTSSNSICSAWVATKFILCLPSRTGKTSPKTGIYFDAVICNRHSSRICCKFKAPGASVSHG